MAVFKFIVGNLKKRKSYSLVISILVVLSSIILIATFSTIKNTNEAYDNAFNSTKSPHLIFWLKENDYKPSFQQELQEQSSVETVKLRDSKFYKAGSLVKNGVFIRGSSDYHIFQYTPEDKMRVFDSSYSEQQLLGKGEIYLPLLFKNQYNLKVGENISYAFGDNKLDFKITGFVEEPIAGGDLRGSKYIFFSKQDIESLAKMAGDKLESYTQIRVRFKQGQEDKINLVEKTFMDENRSSVPSVEEYSEFKNIHVYLPNIALAVISIFAIMLLVITLTIMRYAILATIEADYLNIGVLKALGFTPAMIQLTIVGQYAIISAISSFIGLLASLFVTDILGEYILKSTGLFYNGSFSILMGILIIVFLISVISIFSYITSRRTLKISPINAIAMGIAPVHFSSVFNIKLEKLGLINFDLIMALKQVLTKTKRYIILIFISALLAYSLIFSFSLANFFNSEKSIGMLGIDVSDIQVNAKTETETAAVISKIKADYKVDWVYYEKTQQLEINGEQISAKIRLNFDEPGIISTIEGRHPKHDNEIAISNVIKDKLKKGIGDYLTIKDETGQYKKFIITGIYQSINEMGSTVRLTETGMKTLDSKFDLNESYIRLQTHENLDKTIETMKAKYSGYTEISNQRAETLGQIDTVKNIFSSISKLVFVLTIIMVSLITLLILKITIYSEIKEMGIYKALGFSSRQIRLQLALRFVIVTLFGSSVGIILETLFGAKLFSLALNGVGVTSIQIDTSLINIIIPVATMCILSFVTAIFSSSKIKRISSYALINE